MLSLGEALNECLGDEGSIIYAVNSDDYAKKILRKEKVRFIEQGVDTKEIFVDRVIAYEKPDVVLFDQKYDYKKEDIIRWKRKTKLISIDYIGEDYQLMDKIIVPNAHFEKSKYPEFNNIFGGLKYTIINKNILKLNPKRGFPKKMKNIVVTTGGTDPEGVLIKLIPWLKEMILEDNILVLVGEAFKFKNELEQIMKNLPDNFHVMPYSLQELIKGDIAICTFGVSIYEMIYLQIPTICVSHNRENAHGARILKERYGVIEDMGYVKDINPHNLNMAITRLLTDEKYYINMVDRCDNLLDGEGAKRVGQIIVGGKHV
jgi:spore coat polysaccharide biosynthesis predicted glycosyltransferase SpsG